jgi:hypothetical protein
LLHSPNRPSFVQSSLPTHKRGRITGLKPDMVVRRLPADNGRDDSRYATQFNMEGEIRRLPPKRSDSEGDSSHWFY